MPRTKGGIKYDKKVKSDSRASSGRSMPTPNRDSDSGSKKLREHRERQEARASPGESPEEYREKVQVQKEAAKQTRDVSPMAQKEASQQITAAEKKAILNKHDTSPLRPDKIQNQINQNPQDKPKPFGGASEYAYEKVWRPTRDYFESKRTSAEEKGYKQAENVEMSDFSLTIAEKGKAIASDLRSFGNSGANLIPLEYSLGDKPYIFPKVTNTVGDIVESASMIPGGVDVIRKNPRIIPAAATAGVIGTAKGMGEQLANDPAQFAVDNAVTYGLFAGLGKGAGSLKNTVKYARKEPVPIETLSRPEVVSGEVTFPTAKPKTPIPEVIGTFKKTGERYPGNINPAKEYGIHATGSNLPKKGATLPGTSETPGLYVGPDASLHFTRIMGESKPKTQLFGSDAKAPDPSINFFEMQNIKRLPANLRNDLPAANEYMRTTAEKGVGYTTVKMEQGLKYGPRERELVIPENTDFVLKESGYFTTVNNKKMPVNMYETSTAKSGVKATAERFTGKRKSYGDYIEESARYEDAYSLITPKKVGSALLSGAFESSSKPGNKQDIEFVSSVGKPDYNEHSRSPFGMGSPFREPSIIQDPFERDPGRIIDDPYEPGRPYPGDYEGSSINILDINIPEPKPIKFTPESKRRSKKQKSGVNDWEYDRLTNVYGDIDDFIGGGF